MRAAKLDYWASQADFQIMAVNAWLALAENNKDDALRLMAAAADAEEATDKHPVTPANVASTRELLGEMLLELGRPEDAFAQFKQSFKREPNRFRAISGAARAAPRNLFPRREVHPFDSFPRGVQPFDSFPRSVLLL
jgi:tetratricopeptide (TPR) repeat protein